MTGVSTIHQNRFFLHNWLTRDGGTVGVGGVVCKGDGSKGKTEPKSKVNFEDSKVFFM